MGKRLIIKGADFSQVAVSTEPILNPLAIYGCGNSTWINGGDAPDGAYWVLINNGNLYEKINGTGTVVDMPEGYDSLVLGDVVLVKPTDATRYNAAYPSNLEKVVWEDGGYIYNASQSTEPQKGTVAGFKCAHISLKKGDVLVYNGNSGSTARAIWVMQDDYSETLIISDAALAATYAPIVYVATEDCEVFVNASATSIESYGDSYIYRK